MTAATMIQNDKVKLAFHDFVMRENFPCLGARATLAQESAVIRTFGSLGDSANARTIAEALESFGEHAKTDNARFASLVAVFPEGPELNESEFDRLLWSQLQQLAELDANAVTDAAVSDDPNDPHFSFCFRGVPYFVVGLTPASSRMARRFAWPALVFNPHAVFDRLRSEGKYEKLKNMIRTRDLALQGTLNPNLADFGEASEARQYSGMEHSAEWKCPFHRG